MYIIPSVWLDFLMIFEILEWFLKKEVVHVFFNLDVLILLKPLLLSTASRQMQKRVEQLVTDSFGPQFYGKALDCLKALRQQSIKVTWWH